MIRCIRTGIARVGCEGWDEANTLGMLQERVCKKRRTIELLTVCSCKIITSLFEARFLRFARGLLPSCLGSHTTNPGEVRLANFLVRYQALDSGSPKREVAIDRSKRVLAILCRSRLDLLIHKLSAQATVVEAGIFGIVSPRFHDWNGAYELSPHNAPHAQFPLVFSQVPIKTRFLVKHGGSAKLLVYQAESF